MSLQEDKSLSDPDQVKKTLSNEELKEVYALYKQATCGDVSIEKPGISDIKYLKLGLRKCLIIFIFINYRGSAKWEAWSSKKGMDSETAKKEYIEMVEKMKEKHGMI